MGIILFYLGKVLVSREINRVVLQDKPLLGEKLEAELIRRMEPGFTRVRIIITQEEDEAPRRRVATVRRS